VEKLGYVLLAIVAGCWALGMIVGLIAAFPLGIIVLVGILGVGVLFAKVLKERLESREDDYYSKKVDK